MCIWIILLHPPVDPHKRAFCFTTTINGDRELPIFLEDIGEIRTPKPYLERNQDIADETGILLACPSGFKEVLRSGTWATIRRGKIVAIIFPDGSVETRNKGGDN